MDLFNCRRCGGPMKPGTVLRNTTVGFADFPGDTGQEPGSTQSDTGPARLIDCLKCEACGHSITLPTAEPPRMTFDNWWREHRHDDPCFRLTEEEAFSLSRAMLTALSPAPTTHSRTERKLGAIEAKAAAEAVNLHVSGPTVDRAAFEEARAKCLAHLEWKLDLVRALSYVQFLVH